jgi:cytochrome oxidase Cu insertion factor (SCO1/SenC/PrrC family)
MPGVAAERIMVIPIAAPVTAGPAHTAPFRLSAFAGRTIAVSFVTQASSSVCSDVSGKFAYLQHHIDPRTEHLVTVMLDRTSADDAALARYAAGLAASADRWTFARSSNDAAALEPWLRIELNAPPSTQHAEQVAIIDPSGNLADVVDAQANDPDVIRQALDDVAHGRRAARKREDALRLIARSAVLLAIVFGALFVSSILPTRRGNPASP